jgi:hypothetical protein
MPGLPDEDDTLVDTPYGDALTKSFSVSFGLAHFVVAVTNNSPQVLEDSSIEERYDLAAKATAHALGGRLVQYGPIQQHGHGGREQVIEVEGEVMLHFRVFLVGNRSYQVNITYPPGTVSPNVVTFFLDSFHLNHHSD